MIDDQSRKQWIRNDQLLKQKANELVEIVKRVRSISSARTDYKIIFFEFQHDALITEISCKYLSVVLENP